MVYTLEKKRDALKSAKLSESDNLELLIKEIKQKISEAYND